MTIQEFQSQPTFSYVPPWRTLGAVAPDGSEIVTHGKPVSRPLDLARQVADLTPGNGEVTLGGHDWSWDYVELTSV